MHKTLITLCLLFAGFLFAGEPEIIPFQKTSDWEALATQHPNWAQMEVFLLGEAHFVRANPAAQYHFWRFLYEKYEVKTIGLEFGHAEAWVYNQYLQTGDTNLFHSTVLGKRVPEHRQYLDSLRAFNQQHPQGPMQFVGFDFERLLAMNQVFQIIRNQHPKAPTVFVSWADSLQTLAEPGENRLNVKKLREWMQEDWKKNEKALQSGLGDDYELIQRIVFNPCYHENFSKRDEKMTENYAKWRTEDGAGEKMFMPVGMFHIFRNHKKNLYIRLLNPDGPAKGRVLALISLYEDCMSYAPGGMEKTEILKVFPRYHKKYFAARTASWQWKRALVNTSSVEDWDAKMPHHFLFIRE